MSGDGFFGRRRFRNHLDFIFEFEDSPQSHAHNGVVVGEQDLDGVLHRF
jgi:hypothetical protein